MYRTEFNDYGMDSSIRETKVISRAEQLIREGEEPREAYEQAVREHKYEY
jgi:hypothetical protein